MRSGKRGDLIVRFEVDVFADGKALKLVSKLREWEKDNPSERIVNFQKAVKEHQQT